MISEESEIIDIGRFSKRTLLTGAGFSKNWGGYLSSEVYHMLLLMPQVTNRPELEPVMRSITLDYNFEKILGAVRSDPNLQGLVRPFEDAILQLFAKMDRVQCQNLQGMFSGGGLSTQFNMPGFFRFLKRFWSFDRTLDGESSGFLFTLNQDLLVERMNCPWDIPEPNAPRPTLTGVPNGTPRPEHGFHFFDGNLQPFGPNMVIQFPSKDDNFTPPKLVGANHYVKLHGSMNWRAGDSSLVIFGEDKEEQLSRYPLLTWYEKLFSRVLHDGNVHLFVIGYGFRDKHINLIIESAVRSANLRIFVANKWDQRELSAQLRLPVGDSCFSDLLDRFTAVPAPLSALFPGPPSATHETEELQLISNRFFLTEPRARL